MKLIWELRNVGGGGEGGRPSQKTFILQLTNQQVLLKK